MNLETNLEKLKQESIKIRIKFPGKIPILIEKEKTSLLKNLIRKKYLVPNTMTVGQLILTIRKNIELKSFQALFLFLDCGKIPCNNDLIGNLYETSKNEKTEMLHFIYCEEATFG